MRPARRSPSAVLALTDPVAALKVLLGGLNGTAKPSPNSRTASVSGRPSASRTAPPASGGPNNVVTRNANAMPNVPARPSASALAVIRNGLKTGSGGGQNSPTSGATGRPGTASKEIASRSGARKCAGREIG